MRGTVLNTLTVALGAGIGLAIGQSLPVDLQEIALSALGLVTVGLGLKMFLETRNVLVVAGALAFGAVLGRLLGIDVGFERVADSLRYVLRGEGYFNEGLITATVLFCVGPMTLLGCLQDALEGKLDLLSVKSLMDGVAAVFLAATLGNGVLASAILVFGIQATLTLLATRLRRFAEDLEFIRETSATGGLMLVSVGISLLRLKDMPTELFLPALVLAPSFVQLGRWLKQLRPEKQPEPSSSEGVLS